MHFDLTDDQKMIAKTALAFAKKESPVSRLRALRDDATGYSPDLYRKMGELGWLALILPESVGGLGQSFVDLSLVVEAFGTTLVPEPLVPSVVLGGMAIVHAGTDAQKEKWLTPLAAGELSLALAYAERKGRYDVRDVETRAEKSGSAYKLTGEKVFVLNGHAAGALVVSARTGGATTDADGVSLFVVDAKTPGVSVRPIRTMDGHRAAMITFDGAEVPADALLGAESKAADVLDLVLDLGAAAACAEGVGIIRQSLEMTREYLCTREQFGVKIGTFQALQHRTVEMFVESELAKSTSILASIQAQNPDAVERKTAISVAKAQLSVSGRFVTQQAIQLHGGIGVTDEHDIGLYFKRMNVLQALYGDEEFHLARFASLPAFLSGVA